MIDNTSEDLRKLADSLKDDEIYVLVDVHESWFDKTDYCSVICTDTGAKIKELLQEYINLKIKDNFRFFFDLKAHPVILADECALKKDVPLYANGTFGGMQIPCVNGIRLPMQKYTRNNINNNDQQPS